MASLAATGGAEPSDRPPWDSEQEKKAQASSNNDSNEPMLPQSRQDVDKDTSSTGSKKKRFPIAVKAEGESGRSGLHPMQFARIVWRSTSLVSRCVNVLWPFVPVAIALYWTLEGHDVLKFSFAYIAMVPCANLVGFAGQELARKMPLTLGVLTETTLGSVVEIVLFMVLLKKELYNVIQAAILGSILATMLLCLGMCFFASGLRRSDATFDEAITEAGSGLLLTAGIAIAVPTIFEYSLRPLLGTTQLEWTSDELDMHSLHISHAVAILLLLSYIVYTWFQMRTHHGIHAAIFELDEERNHDREKDIEKPKLTLTEAVVALIVALALVTITAYVLVNEIEPLVELTNISDPFMGLILVPLVEKAAEHLSAVDEAWDNQMNFALSHCIGATIQTAMLNAPLVVIVGWGLDLPMSLNFQIFDMVMLILSIITVGNFLRDQKTNYLEGFLCVVVYVVIAVAAYFFPNLEQNSEGSAL